MDSYVFRSSVGWIFGCGTRHVAHADLGLAVRAGGTVGSPDEADTTGTTGATRCAAVTAVAAAIAATGAVRKTLP